MKTVNTPPKDRTGLKYRCRARWAGVLSAALRPCEAAVRRCMAASEEKRLKPSKALHALCLA